MPEPTKISPPSLQATVKKPTTASVASPRAKTALQGDPTISGDNPASAAAHLRRAEREQK